MGIIISLIIQLSIVIGYSGDADFSNMSEEQQIEYVRDVNQELID